MEQITLNFDASEFDGFDSLQEFYAHRTRRIKDRAGSVVKQCVQAMEMDYSPSQWSQKLNKSNNTALTLDDIDRHTELYGDVTWIYYAIHRHIIRGQKSREELLQLRAEIDRQLSVVGNSR